MDYVVAELIENHYKGSWLALQNSIANANRDRWTGLAEDEEKPKIYIDRRKLQQIVAGEDVPLTRYELELLDSYLLHVDGVGLAEVPIFRRRENLFHTIANSSRVSFFVGSRTIGEADMISRWDVSALNAMKDPISNHVETESFEVPSRDTGRHPNEKEWQALRNQTTGNVVVSVGSPIASASSEYLLGEIFGTAAYKRPAKRLPVQFAHPSADAKSAFMLRPKEVEGLKAKDAAVLIDGEIRISGTDGRDFGVVVARRMTRDHALFVIAGNRGPGTFAAARSLASGQINVSLPPFPRNDDGWTRQPVLVALVSTSIRAEESDRSIDRRTVGEILLESPPALFVFSERCGWELQK